MGDDFLFGFVVGIIALVLPIYLMQIYSFNWILSLVYYIILFVLCEIGYYHLIKKRSLDAPYDFLEFLFANFLIFILTEWLTIIAMGISRLVEWCIKYPYEVIHKIWQILDDLEWVLWVVGIIGSIVGLVMLKKFVYDTWFVPMITEMKEKREEERIAKQMKKEKRSKKK